MFHCCSIMCYWFLTINCRSCYPTYPNTWCFWWLIRFDHTKVLHFVRLIFQWNRNLWQLGMLLEKMMQEIGRKVGDIRFGFAPNWLKFGNRLLLSWKWITLSELFANWRIGLCKCQTSKTDSHTAHFLNSSPS